MRLTDLPGLGPDALQSRVAAAVADPQRLEVLERLRVLDTLPEETFDSVTAVAAEVCETPTALVSLVDRDRQWFKSRVGFERTQTGLDSSVCAHALLGTDTLVIPDLTADECTRRNPLVTGPEAIRFYAGAPIVTAAGHPLGAVCVIDVSPRPGGLTPRQDAVLRQLARQVASMLELRGLLVERDDLLGHLKTAHELAAEERRRLAALFDNAPSFMALQRGPDHVFEMVNPAYAEIVGRHVIGLSVREALPDGEEQDYAEVLDRVFQLGEPESFEAARYVMRAGPDRRPVERFLDFLFQPYVEGGKVAGISTIGYDVTERVRQLRRQAALAGLGERFRTLRDPEAVTRAAAQTMAEALGASRAGIGTVDPERGTVLMHRNWRAEGAAPVEGLFRFADYGSFLEDLKRGETVILADIETDPRSADQRDAMRDLGIRVLLNIPVVERGRLVMLAFVHFDDIRPLSDDDLLFVTQVADRPRRRLRGCAPTSSARR